MSRVVKYVEGPKFGLRVGNLLKTFLGDVFGGGGGGMFRPAELNSSTSRVNI